MAGTKGTGDGGRRNPGKDDARDDPRAAALRANLAKRKGQSSARRKGKAVGKNEASAFDSLKDEPT